MTSVDTAPHTYTPGFVKGWAWVVDSTTGTPLCQDPFEARSPAEAVTTVALNRDFQRRAAESVQKALGSLSPTLATKAKKFLVP